MSKLQTDLVKADLVNRRFLVVEDDANLRGSIQNVLVLKGATVSVAENGLVGKTLLEQNGPFDAILSDIRMPQMDGVQLLKFAKQNYKDTKFLLFTGFSEYLETQSAFDLGADAFLAKPFKLAELLGLLGELLGKANGEPPTIDEQNFCCVGVDEFFSTTKLPSDLYVKIGQTKFVKLAHEGAEIELPRLQQIKDKQVKFLYVRTEDFHKYTGLNLKLANAVERSSQIPPEKKMSLFKHTSEMLVQQAFVSGIDKGVCDNAAAMLNNTLKAINDNDDLMEVLVDMQSKGDGLYNHSLLVSLYASMIATQMGWTSPSNQQKIALAALFHDVGFKELPVELQTIPRFKMTADNIRLYESHPGRSREILGSIAGYPADLVAIVGQHHENANGTGYPQGLPASKIHPIAKLLRLTDELIDKLPVGQKLELSTIQSILTELFETRREEFDYATFAGAYDLFKMPKPSGLKNKAS